MAKFALTNEQQRAVDYEGSAVLVSAAAGSGKTRVLTERLMRRVTGEKGRDIDKFLIITYTRAAAAELRGRILEELSGRCAAEPQNRRLRRQSSLCYSAPIGTIHSFCTAVIRENCHELGLGADFRVGDEDRCALLKNRALDRVLDEAYEHIGERPGFAALVASVGAGSDDQRLTKTLLQLHTQLLSHPYPERWARSRIDSILSGDTQPFVSELMARAGQTARYWRAALETCWNGILASSTENEPLIAAYGDSITITLSELRGLERALELGWDETCAALPVHYPRLGSLRGFENEALKDSFTALRTAAKKATDKLSAVFDAPLEKQREDLISTAPAMTALLELTLKFDEAYCAEKRRCSLLDFSDLEHLAVRLLCDEETGLPTATAQHISERFEEIMVDEYQDVSAVQELILQCVSQSGKKLFMVGDVKQSIYRFRLADPTIFLGKYERFTAPGEPGEGVRLHLRRNFRSDTAILSGCNSVFSRLMSRELGEIEYDADSALYPPDAAPEPTGEVSMTVLGISGGEEGEERPDKQALEARWVAEKIKALVEGGEEIADGGKKRPLRYSDFAILLHSPRSVGAIYAKALADAGVPCSGERSGSFFAAPEIIAMTAFLQVIDDPRRDVPLAAALSSPMFGFTADELALIRAAKRHCDFYTALLKRAQTDEKCRKFIAFLSEQRSLATDLSARRLINRICQALDLPAVFSGKGARNLMLLSDLAQQYEASGYRGLSGFLDSLESMKSRNQEPSVASGETESVSIMSIHRSKGLEFPVVFLSDTARKFNLQELASPVLTHPMLGVGGKVYQRERSIEFPGIAHRAIKSRLTTEALSEELRVLYVAMTRAKQRLYISCASSDPEKLIASLKTGMTGAPSPEQLRSSQSPAGWLLSAALSDGGQNVQLSVEYPRAENTEPAPAPEKASEKPDKEALHALREKLDFSYPYAFAQSLPAKLTATMLPETEDEEPAASLLPERARIFRRIELSTGERPLTAAERGTATHLVMQYIDFSKTGSRAELEGEVARIAALGLLSPAQAKAVDLAAIERFFASDLGGRIAGADRVYREQRFSVFCPAELYFPGAGDEKLLLQGVVDCCIEEAGKLTIIDYKTDHVTEATLPETARRYERQLRAYAWAMERITKMPVRGCTLCFLSAGLSVEF